MFWEVSGILTILTSCGVALRWGGLDEKLTAVGYIIAAIASSFADGSHYGHTENGVLAIDAIVLFGLLVLALRSDRFWPLWATAFQLIATLVHIASLTEHGNFAWAYFVALIFWSYPVFIALGAGTWLEARRRREWGMAT